MLKRVIIDTKQLQLAFLSIIQKHLLLSSLIIAIIVIGIVSTAQAIKVNTNHLIGTSVPISGSKKTTSQTTTVGDYETTIVDTSVDTETNQKSSSKSKNDSNRTTDTPTKQTAEVDGAKIVKNQTADLPSQSVETAEQKYMREYRNLHQAGYSLSQTPVRSEYGGYIYYTVTMQVAAFDNGTYGTPTLFLQLTPATHKYYSCVNPVGTMVKFTYGTRNNSISISCKIRPCPECYYPGGPLPYYGSFSVEIGGIIGNSVPTGVSSQDYDLSPGYDKPS
jgi:hypothetical protein